MKNKLALIPKMVKTISYNRKIKVPDIKQYLVEEYQLTKELTKENKELRKTIEELNIEKQKLDLTLITLNEYKNRIDEKNQDIKELQNKIKQNERDTDLLREERNTLKIEKNEISKYCKKLEQEINKKNQLIESKFLIKFKNNLIEIIKKQKGNLSKTKVINIIQTLKQNEIKEEE